MRPSSWNGVGAIAKVPAALAVSLVMYASLFRHSGLALRAPGRRLFESPRRLLDLLVGEEDFLGVGDDILGLPPRERRRPAFHLHHPHLADATGAGDAEHLASLVAGKVRDHV